MGIFTFEEEHNSTLAPAKLYKTFVKDSHNIIPKVVEAIQSVEIVEGNGGPGTIKKITAVEGGKSSYVLHKVEAIDEANLVYNYSIVGGTELEDKLEKVSFETKVLPGPHGGSVLKITTKFYTKEVREATKFVKEVNIIQGDGEAGSIEQVNFNEASPFKYLKQRSDVLDKDNLVCKYTTMAAGSSSVPYVVPYPGRYSAHPQQLYGGYPQPQSGFGVPFATCVRVPSATWVRVPSATWVGGGVQFYAICCAVPWRIFSSAAATIWWVSTASVRVRVPSATWVHVPSATWVRVCCSGSESGNKQFVWEIRSAGCWSAE